MKYEDYLQQIKEKSSLQTHKATKDMLLYEILVHACTNDKLSRQQTNDIIKKIASLVMTRHEQLTTMYNN